MERLETNLATGKRNLCDDKKSNDEYFYGGRNIKTESTKCVVCEKEFGHMEYKGKKLCLKCLNELKLLV